MAASKEELILGMVDVSKPSETEGWQVSFACIGGAGSVHSSVPGGKTGVGNCNTQRNTI